MRFRHVLKNLALDELVRAPLPYPGEADTLARSGLAVGLARRDVVAHAARLIVGEPELAAGRIEVQADRVAHAVAIDLSPVAVRDSADGFASLLAS